ncbi:MAG: hypothetical protein ACP5D2_00305 [Candidatus Nanoarchaeia archaeon]
MKEVDNILRILKETRQAIEEKDSYKIKKLSNQTIHAATISQDADNIIVAVLVYSISKIVEREQYKDMKGWKQFYQSLINNLDLAISSLKANNIEKCRQALGKIREAVNQISSDLGIYIEQVFRKAQINKAARIYEHGLSAGRTANLLGISLWELAGYIGNSSVSEIKKVTGIPVKKRIKYAEDFFK